MMQALIFSSAFNALYLGRNIGWGTIFFEVSGNMHIYGGVDTTTKNYIWVFYDPYQYNRQIGSNSSITVGLIVESRTYFKSSAIYVSGAE